VSSTVNTNLVAFYFLENTLFLYHCCHLLSFFFIIFVTYVLMMAVWKSPCIRGLFKTSYFSNHYKSLFFSYFFKQSRFRKTDVELINVCVH